MLKHWSSDEPLSPLAPSWRIPFFETNLKDAAACHALREAVRRHSVEVLSLPSGSDGNTGLGATSMTARFQRYNVLSWEDPSIQLLKRSLHRSYLEFIGALGLERQRVYIQCWANALRAGQFIGRHVHTTGPWGYISGNLSLSNSPAQTVYNYLYDDAYALPMPSLEGRLVLFPSYIPHRTTRHVGSDTRISIAFDIALPEGRRPDRSYVLFDVPNEDDALP